MGIQQVRLQRSRIEIEKMPALQAVTKRTEAVKAALQELENVFTELFKTNVKVTAVNAPVNSNNPAVELLPDVLQQGTEKQPPKGRRKPKAQWREFVNAVSVKPTKVSATIPGHLLGRY